MTEFLVPRPAVAETILTMLTPDPFLGSLSGLFLAAPRRTGKSTFLRTDLSPLLKAKGKTVLYVDLWADQTSDPGELIFDCIRAGLEEHAGAIRKFQKSNPVQNIGLLGFSISFKSAAEYTGTPSDALQLLTTATGQDVVLIVDEAQQSLESEKGLAAMFALKAARDAVNQRQGADLPKLYLIMTGSHRDKLAALVYDQKSPFFGAQVRDFPPLGMEYSRALAERVNAHLSDENQIPVDEMDKAFARLGRKPEMLLECLRDLVLEPVGAAVALEGIVERKKAQMEAARRSEIAALSKLQQAILRLIARERSRFAPFTAETRHALAEVNGGRDPSVGAIQKALDVLREKGFVWRPGYGAYALENAEIIGALDL